MSINKVVDSSKDIMLPDEVKDEDLRDYIELLRNELQQSANTIEFLHGCLTDDIYSYANPQMTLNYLDKLEKITGKREFCIHSRTHKGCKSCEARNESFRIRAKFQKD